MATHPFDGRTATDLIALADLALYDAKDAGGGVAVPGDHGLASAAVAPPSGVANLRRRAPAAGEELVAGSVGSGEA